MRIADKRIAPPREFEPVVYPVSVRIGEERISAVYQTLHFVRNAVAIRIAGGVGCEIDATAALRQKRIAPIEENRIAGKASQVQPRHRVCSVRGKVRLENISGQSASEYGEIRKCAKRIDRHIVYFRGTGMRTHPRRLAIKPERERLECDIESRREENRISGDSLHRRNFSSCRIYPAIG